MTKPHWTQTPAGRKRLSKQMKAHHAGERKPAASAKHSGGIDVKSAIIYLRQAQGKSPRFAKALAELALLTLLGEDK
jgi:hypothetical protein